jgi:adenylate cyclase
VIEPIGYTIVGLVASGMAVSFFAADPHSPTSRSLSLLWLLFGIAMFLQLLVYADQARDPSLIPFWQRTFSVFDAVALICACEWILRIGRTEATSQSEHAPDWMIRAAQGAAIVYGVVGVVIPERRHEIWANARHLEQLSHPEFFLFAIPYDLVFVILGFRIVQLLRGDLDSAEKVRLRAGLIAGPFWAVMIAVREDVAPIFAAIGEVVFLFGAIRYHVLQGQRGQFLARFLSPELATLVRERGLASMTERRRVELSAVACDLRGFTGFAETAAPEDAMKLLDDYYETVGAVVAEFGGSVKDFAGDGILALVGAPIARGDHARRAIEMAVEIRDRVNDLLAHWKNLGIELGLGVGVASGFATVGAIGGSGRLEYGAIGPVVNLASRLAARAEAGRVLAEPRVAGLAGSDSGAYRFEKLEAMELKGFARPVAPFAVESANGHNPKLA